MNIPPNHEPVLYCVRCTSLQQHLIASESRCGEVDPPVYEQLFACLVCGQHRRYGFTTAKIWKSNTIDLMRSLFKQRKREAAGGIR